MAKEGWEAHSGDMTKRDEEVMTCADVISFDAVYFFDVMIPLVRELLFVLISLTDSILRFI